MPWKPKTKGIPRKVLHLNDLDQAKRAVLNALGSAASVRAYSHAIDDFIEWYSSEPRLAFSKSVVLRYRIGLEPRRLSASTINLQWRWCGGSRTKQPIAACLARTLPPESIE
jgi:hypothetical protein